MDSALMYEAIVADEVQVISAYSTDGRIAAYNLRLLEDDREAIPPYDAIVLAGPGLARSAPAVIDALQQLGGAIDAEWMRAMNRRVDEEGESVAAVADELVDRLAAGVR